MDSDPIAEDSPWSFHQPETTVAVRPPCVRATTVREEGGDGPPRIVTVRSSPCEVTVSAEGMMPMPTILPKGRIRKMLILLRGDLCESCLL